MRAPKQSSGDTLINNACWWHGPDFFSQGKDNWPEQKFTRYQAETVEKVRADVCEQTEER